MDDVPPGYGEPRPLFTDELGTTYAARETGTGREVALRVLALTVPSRPARRQLRSSCLAAAALTGHPGVLDLYEVGFTDGHHPYLATARPAGSLADLLARHGPLPAAQAAGLGAALAGTLTAAHDKGILHLDVRPASVVHTQAPAPLLAYFGVSRAVSVAGQAELPAEYLLHAAREMFGWDTPGPAADVYGLASTVYTALAGQAPYAAEARLGRAALYQRALRGGPAPVPRPGIPPALTALIAAMMDPDPGSRPAITDVAAELAGIGPPELAATVFRPTGPLTAGTGQVPAAAAVLPLRVPAPPPAQPSSGAEGAPPVPAALSPPAPAPFPAPSPGPVPPGPVPPGPPAPGPFQPAQHPDSATPAQQASSPFPDAARERTARPAAAQEPGTARRGRHTGLILLLGAGVVALLAGFVWGIVTAPAARPRRPAPTIQATAAASPMPAAEQAQYQVTRVRVVARPGGARIRWARPARTGGVTAFIVVAELGGRAEQEHTVGSTGHGAVFAGLRRGHRYCFVVGTVVETASGQAGTATAPQVCSVVR
ncbi:MAG TPA: protein kinase [Streptosporangiaceae bacterium]|nr:protein kinase [Streptosporangiaceae bacterium]